MARNIQARKKLSDLYKRGVFVRFGPDGGRVGEIDANGKAVPFPQPLGDDQVEMYVTPPSPLQRQQAMSDAQAHRARALIKLKRDHESEEYLTAMAFVAEMSEPTLIDYVLSANAEERRSEAVRDVLAEDEWKDMTALQDALRTFDEENTDEDDPEFRAVMARDAEYGEQVNERFISLTDAAREALQLLSRAEVERRALDRRGDLVGSQRFMEHFEMQMSYYAIRDSEPPHTLMFYDSPREFAEADDIVQETIQQAIGLFLEDQAAAKNSQGAVSGSESSAPPAEPETSEASTPATASA